MDKYNTNVLPYEKDVLICKFLTHKQMSGLLCSPISIADRHCFNQINTSWVNKAVKYIIRLITSKSFVVKHFCDVIPAWVTECKVRGHVCFDLDGVTAIFCVEESNGKGSLWHNWTRPYGQFIHLHNSE